MSAQRYIAFARSHAKPWFIWTTVAAAAISTIACRNTSVEPPAATPGPIATVTGKERVGWTQSAADTAELATFHYAIYVDGVRSELTGASCSPSSSTPSTFDCSAPLPALSPGIHTLQITSFSVNGGLAESARSPALQVNKISATVPSPAPRSTPAAEWPSRIAVTTSDELHLRLDRIAQGLVNPTDIAFLSDGRALVAEEPGRVRIITSDGELLAAPALVLGRGRSTGIELLSLAADQRGSVYAVYAAPSRLGSRVFTVARFREASNVLTGEVPVLDSVDASAPSAAASVRVDADGKLFVAFDDGGDPRRAGDFASPNGKILRLNPDGTTPDDQAALSPMYLPELRSPAGFDWQPGSRLLWIADRIADGQASLSAVSGTVSGRRRGTRIASYTLPADAQPSSAAFYAGSLIPRFTNDLLIASDQGRHLLRVQFDRTTGTRVTATERLLQDTIGGVRVVAVSPTGKVYVATSDSVAALTPDP